MGLFVNFDSTDQVDGYNSENDVSNNQSKNHILKALLSSPDSTHNKIEILYSPISESELPMDDIFKGPIHDPSKMLLYPELEIDDNGNGAVSYPPKNSNVKGEIVEDAMFRKFLRESTLSNSSVRGFNTWIPGVRFTNEEAYLYNAFINGFIISVSPQIAHQNLLPGTVFIPAGIHNPILRKFFLSCGASFVCQALNNNVEENWLNIASGDETIKEVQNFIELNPIAGNNSWILIFLLLTCLKQKFFFEGAISQALNMISAYEIVKLWKNNKIKENNGQIRVEELGRMNEISSTNNDSNKDEYKDINLFDTSMWPVSPDSFTQLNFEHLEDNFDKFDGINFDNTTYPESSKVYNKLIRKLKGSVHTESVQNNKLNNNTTLQCFDVTDLEFELLSTKITTISGIKLLPYERPLLETFILNYSSSMFITPRSLIPYLTSPFEVFKELAPFLTQPLYKCAVPWMNHPVVGAALPIVELQAKINWLSLRTPLSPQDFNTALKIRKLAKYYLHPILPTEIRSREPKNIQRRLMESCYVSDIIAKAVFIFSTKLLWPETKADDPEIQGAVDAVYNDLLKLNLHSQSAVIAKWAFAIIGSATIKRELREYFVCRIGNFADALKTGSLRTVLKFFQACWGTEENPGILWDALLDENYIKILVI